MIFNKSGDVTHLVSISVNTDAKLDYLTREVIGDQAGEYRIAEVPRELTSPSSDDTPQRGRHLKVMRWSHSPNFTQWLTSTDP